MNRWPRTATSNCVLSVNYMGENKDGAADAAKKLCATTKAENVPFVVPNEFENGPADYGINAKAEVTVLVAKEGKVTANYAFAKAKDVVSTPCSRASTRP